MNELEAPPIPSKADIFDFRTAAGAALVAATRRRNEIEMAIRTATAIEDLAALHDQWGEVVEQQDAAETRIRELNQLLAEMN